MVVIRQLLVGARKTVTVVVVVEQVQLDRFQVAIEVVVAGIL